MNPTRPLVPLLWLTLLAGCGNGGPSVSGSADERAGSQSGLSSLWERVRGVSVENGRTVEMPALGLMADAFLADAVVREVPLATVGSDVLSVTVDGERAAFDRTLDDILQRARKLTRKRDGVPASPGSPLDLPHQLYAAPIFLALQPRKGWEVQALDDRPTPEFDTPFFRKHRPPSDYDPELHVRYMEMLAISAIYTNDVFALLDERLGGAKLADPDDAQARVLAAFQAIPTAQLKAMLENATRKVVGGRFNTDLTGSGNVHFTHAPAGDFVADARGLTWTKAGGVWFGDGHINGQTVNLRLASTTSLSQRQAQSGTAGTTAGAELSGSGSAGPR